MKKYYFLIIVALIFGLVLTGCSLLSNVGQVPSSEQSGVAYLTKGAPGDPPDVLPLYAGQNIDVGTVSVWNDGINLYVEYNTTGDWVMTETHLAVADLLDGIPQTKKGNPIPGRFEHSMEHDPAVTEYTYVISLDSWDPCPELFIAAHAKVIRPIEGCYKTVWLIGDVEGDDGTGHLTNYCDEFNYAGFYEGLGPLDPPFTDPFVVGTTFTNMFPWLSLSSYATDFKVQWFGELLFGGKLTVSWSPGASAATETKIITSLDDGVPFTFVASGGDDPAGWYRYPLVQSDLELDPIGGGSHEIRFQHTTGDGAIWDWVLLEKPCEQEETAWAADGEVPGSIAFSGKNWATYFKYTVEYNMVGTWIMDLFLGTTSHDRFIIVNTQVDGVIDGYLGIEHPPDAGNITGTMEGTIECRSVYMIYTRTIPTVTGYTAEFQGTMSLDGESLSGTWADNKPTPNVGTWTAYRQ